MTTQSNETQIPEKFFDKEKNEIRVDALLKSYLELEKKLAQSKNEAPQSLIDIPVSPADYAITISHEMFTIDDEINARLHEKGFSNEQAQFLYDLAAEKMVPLVLEIAQEFEAERQLDKLIATFGSKERFAEVSRQLLAYGKKALPKDVLDGLASTYEGVMALCWAAQMLAIAFVIVETPEKAGPILDAMQDLDTIWTVGLSVLGIYVYKRSQEKKRH